MRRSSARWSCRFRRGTGARSGSVSRGEGPRLKYAPSRGSSALPLLVAGVRGADHAHDALAADHLALHADLLHRSTDLHGFLQPEPEKSWNNRAFRTLPRRTPTAATTAAGASPARR